MQQLGDAADLSDEGFVAHFNRQANETVAARSDKEEGAGLDAGAAKLDVLSGGKSWCGRVVRGFEVKTDDAPALLSAQCDAVGPPAACRCCHMRIPPMFRDAATAVSPFWVPPPMNAGGGRPRPASRDWAQKNFAPLMPL